MAIGKCYRCKTVVEPYLSPQWFVKIKPLAEPAIKAVEDGRIRIIPEGWTNNYLGLDAGHQRLVHLTPNLVGASNSCLVLPTLQQRADH